MITSIILTNDTVVINWSSVAAAIYRLQSVDSLDSTNWNDVSPDVTATGPTSTQTNVLDGASERFYRIRVLAP